MLFLIIHNDIKVHQFATRLGPATARSLDLQLAYTPIY